MTTYETITVRVLDVKRRVYPPERQDIRAKETLEVVDENERRFALVRFIRDNENPIVEGEKYWYQGKLKPGNEKFPTPTFEDVNFIGDSPDGVPIAFWPKAVIKPEDVEHDCLMGAFGDVHSAAPMAAVAVLLFASATAEQGAAKPSREQIDILYRENLIHYARLAHQVHKELTAEYVKERTGQND